MLRKFSRLWAAGLFACLFSFTAAQAQDLPGDVGDFEIETGTAPETGFDWSRYIGGAVGVVAADGDTTSRQLAALQLDFNLPASDRLKTFISVDFADFENSYTQELRDHVRDRRNRCARRFPDADEPPEVELSGETLEAHMARTDWTNNRCNEVLDENGGYLDPERETEVADSFADLREAYVQWQPTDFATLTLGRQSLVWGQFSFLSPVGFLLPTRAINTSPRPARADFSYAQDAVNLAVYPSRNNEIQLIHVPAMRIDPSVEENLKSYAQNRYDDNAPVFPDAGDYDMSAVRFTHYGERLTFAVTALDGTQQFLFDPVRDTHLVRSESGYAYANPDSGLKFADLEAVALEFSYILNSRWTLKGEYTAYESFDTLDFSDLSNLSDRDRRIADVIVRPQHEGRLYQTFDETFMALGFEYDGDDWFGHFQLVSLDNQPSSPADQEIEDIKDENRDESDDDSDVAPIFFIGRRLGAEDDGFAGFGATAFFNAYAVGFFGGWRLNEDVEIGGLIGSVVDVTDSGPPDDDHYDENLDDGDGLVQIGISYLF